MATSAAIECEFYENSQAERVSKYSLSPLTIVDIEKVNLSVRSRLLRAVRESLKDCKDAGEADAMLSAAIREAASVSFLSPGCGAVFRTMDALADLLCQSLGKGHSAASAMGILRDSRNAEEFQFAFAFINGLINSREAKQEAENPTISPILSE